MAKDGVVSIERKGTHLVARIGATFVSQHEAPAITEQVSRAIAGADGAGACFVLDVSVVEAMSSMGVGMCVDLRNRATDRGFRPVLFGMNNALLDVIRLMRVERLFTVAATRADLDRLLS